MAAPLMRPLERSTWETLVMACKDGTTPYGVEHLEAGRMLESLRLVERTSNGRKIFYRITEAGRRVLREG